MTWTQGKNEAERHYEREMTREILVSERLRVSILAAIFSTLLLAYLFFSLSFPEQLHRLFPPSFRSFTVVIFLTVVIAYEWVVRERLGRLIDDEKVPRTLFRYSSAFNEISIPTIAIILVSRLFDPVFALLTPLPLVYFLFIGLSALRLDLRLSAFTGVVAALEYSGLALIFIRQSTDPTLNPMFLQAPYYLGKAAILLLAGLVTGFVALQIKKSIFRSFKSVEERNRVIALFGQHVSPEVVDKLLTQEKELDAEMRHVCIMFLDIRDFSRFSEKRSPEIVMSYLNTLFDFMINIVNRNHGIVNKFLGDGFMAVFGAPLSNGEDSRNAVKAALEILDQVDDEIDSGRILPTRIGIGLHAGEAITGSVGSSTRKEFTLIGDVVNLASRIEKLNKRFKSQFLISDTVMKSSNGTIENVESLGPVSIQGLENPVSLYRVA